MPVTASGWLRWFEYREVIAGKGSKPKNLRIGALWLVVAVLVASGTLGGQPASLFGRDAESASPIQVTTRLEPAAPPTGGELTLLAKVVLAPGVHLYGHTLRFHWSELQGVGEPRVDLPPAKEVPDQWGLTDGDTVAVYEDTFTVTVVFPVTGPAGQALSLRGSVEYQGCTDTFCFMPESAAVVHSATIAPAEAAPDVPGRTGPGERASPSIHWFWELVGAFGWGVLVSFTPCVYPMIPITAAVVAGAVGLEAAEGASSRATLRALAASLVYVLGLSLVYAVLGLASATLGAAVRVWLDSWVIRIPIAAVFVLFALVMFEVVHLELPGGLGTKLQQLGARGGYAGVLLVGVGAGLVASPCLTAPLAALLGRVAQTGDRWLGFWSLFAMAWGMGLLLIVAGTFSGSMLPRAGPWMSTVRNLFGFVMLWAVVWVLGPVLGESAYNVGVGLVVVAAVVFLGGLDALGADSGVGDRTKRYLGLVALVVGIVYLVVGLGGLLGVGLASDGAGARPGIPFLDADAAGLEAALGSDRPVLVDFYTQSCVACKEMEATTFRDPEVVREAGGFAALRIDLEAEPELGRRYGVLGAPTMLVFAPGRRSPVEKLEGMVEAGELLEALRRVP